MPPKDADGMTNSVDTDQTAPGVDLQCLPRPICPKIWKRYGDTQGIKLTALTARVLQHKVKWLTILNILKEIKIFYSFF